MLIYMTPQESMAEEEYGGHLDQSLDSFRFDLLRINAWRLKFNN